MGIRNYLIEGGSGTGKTAVCEELQRRGYHAVDGDRELAYRGDPETDQPTAGVGLGPRATHEQHLWHLDKVEALVSNQDEAVTFFCGGARNSAKVIHLFDGVFILEVDLKTLNRRIDERVLADPDDWGGRPAERELIKQLHQTSEGLPDNGIAVDATAPLAMVVDEILRHVGSARVTKPKPRQQTRYLLWAISIDADAWPTALVPPGDAAEKRVDSDPPLHTRFASPAVLHATSCSDLVCAESTAGEIAERPGRIIRRALDCD